MSEESKAKTLIEEARELLIKATPGPWFDFESGEWVHEPKSLLANYDDAVIIARAPEIISQLCDELDQQTSRIATQAESLSTCHDLMKLQKEAIESAIRCLQGTSDKTIDQVKEQLRSSITPKGEQS